MSSQESLVFKEMTSLKVQAKSIEFAQAHDYLPRRQREAWPAIEQAFSKAEEFGCIETAFRVLAGREPTMMGPRWLAEHLKVLSDATTAKLIDMMIDRKLIPRATIDLVTYGIGCGWIGNHDSDGVRLSKYRRRWAEQVQAQEGEHKALQDEYLARWQPVSDFIAQKVTEARDYADGAHGLLTHRYGHNLSGANFGYELQPALTAPPKKDALRGVHPALFVTRILVGLLTNGISEQAKWFGEEPTDPCWKHE
ncbi:hypothetical protein BO86DRAFT_376165 [Aspergillus japonicus CBS 114.51]|uniref:Uncharacterized protein n=1 Tax=Aspergillus japonicus CBS 114.51 TaxID=1448312 RepID=A0A8T8XDG2_ASPJA|nr:hypothetical protein BO86DRAFT_376165 [Aspergillus japonicus CBS 114.51]RAH85854.1 hypothetical protein BO86DRAFT_376165 [Aspergillus japonicus CBS 114.51]